MKQATYTLSFDGDTLLVLTLEGIAEESNRKVERRREHAVSNESASARAVKRNELSPAYCDSVRKTGIVFVSEKFCNSRSRQTPWATINGRHLQQEAILDTCCNTEIICTLGISGVRVIKAEIPHKAVASRTVSGLRTVSTAWGFRLWGTYFLLPVYMSCAITERQAKRSIIMRTIRS